MEGKKQSLTLPQQPCSFPLSTGLALKGADLPLPPEAGGWGWDGSQAIFLELTLVCLQGPCLCLKQRILWWEIPRAQPFPIPHLLLQDRTIHHFSPNGPGPHPLEPPGLVLLPEHSPLSLSCSAQPPLFL